MKLNEENVQEIFSQCASGAGPLPGNPPHEVEPGEGPPLGQTQVDGIMHRFRFYEESLQRHETDIAELLGQLPWQFREGWTFLNSCNDHRGSQWTGLHEVMEKLWCLGIAAGMVHYSLPREYWKNLYGGMPYLTITRYNLIAAPSGEDGTCQEETT